MTTLIQNPTAEMEVIETTVSNLPESAQRAGERIARKYRAQGHACECIGVVELVKSLGVEEETSERIPVAFGMVKPATRTHYFEQTVYVPVIFPKSSMDEE